MGGENSLTLMLSLLGEGLRAFLSPLRRADGKRSLFVECIFLETGNSKANVRGNENGGHVWEGWVQPNKVVTK
ncbi:hypothetical protein ACLOJK_021159 [Asimina triloba]